MQRECHRPQGLLIAAVLLGPTALLLWGCEQSLPPIDGNEITLSTDNFDAEVLQSDLPVLVDFWAEWCGPCRQMEPVVAHLSVNYDGRLKVGKVDTDEHPGLAEQYQIEGIPTLLLFDDGEVVAQRSGYCSLSSLSAWVDSQLPSGAASAALSE